MNNQHPVIATERHLELGHLATSRNYGELSPKWAIRQSQSDAVAACKQENEVENSVFGYGLYLVTAEDYLLNGKIKMRQVAIRSLPTFATRVITDEPVDAAAMKWCTDYYWI